MFTREFKYWSGKASRCISTFNFRYNLSTDYTTTSAIKEINLELQHNYEICLAITIAETQAGKLLKEKLLLNFAKKNGLNFLRANSPHYLYVKSEDGRYKNLQPIIQFLHAHDAIDFVTRDMLLSDLSFPIWSEKVRAMLISVAEKNIAEAKKKAFEWNGYDCDYAIFDLAEHLKSLGEYQDAVELYQEIPADHNKYKAAQLSMRDILILMLQAHHDHAIELSPQEVKKYKEDLLKLSLNAGDTQYATQLFFELSGMQMRTDYPEIKPDGETLVMITREISKLTSRIAELESAEKSKPTPVFKLFDKNVSGDAPVPSATPSQGETNTFKG